MVGLQLILKGFVEFVVVYFTRGIDPAASNRFQVGQIRPEV